MSKQSLIRLFFFASIMLGLIYSSFENYLFFHILVEGLCIVIGLGVMVIAFNTHTFTKNDSLLLLGVSYSFVAGFDFIHTITYKGMNIFSGLDANVPTQLWIIARYIESISLVIVSIFLNRRTRVSKLTFLYSVISAFLLLSVFYWNIFPNCFVEGIGLTSFKKISEYIICGILLIAISFLVRKKESQSREVFFYLILSITLTAISELFFVFYVSVYGLSNMLGHIFKLLSFYFVYKSIVQTYLKEPYHLLNKTNIYLEEVMSELEESNAELQSENDKRRAIEKELLKDQAVLNSILNSTEAGFMVINIDGELMKINNQLINMWQIPEKIIEKREAKDIIRFLKDHCSDSRKILLNFQQKPHASKENIHYIKAKDGRIIEQLYKPLITDGEILGSIWSFRDITNSLHLVSQLKDHEMRYQTLVEMMPEGIGIIDKGKYIYANKALAKILQVGSPEQLMNQNQHDFLRTHPSCSNTIHNILLEILEKKRVLPFLEQKIILHNGTVLDIEAAGFPYSINEDTSAVIIVRDISGKKQKEQLQKDIQQKQIQLEKEQEYNKTITQFFSMISHELKTPLNVILGTVQLLQVSEFHAENTSFKKYIYVMKQNCHRLLRLINNLIDITKIDSGFLHMNYKNYNIVSIVEDITLSIVEYTRSKGIELVFDTDIEEKIIACDADKIERVLLNLLSNAIKFSNPGGIIEVNIQDADENIIISIKDTGIGIPEDMQEKIFDKFRQVNDPLSRRAEGSGIGLSLVKSIVELHGGTIGVKSIYGQGSEFIIKLPAIFMNSENNEYDEIASTGEINIERINIEFSDIYS
ncbi:MASE3 domain-containing protein [Anaerosolibacter carboniphilus]